MRSHDHRRHAPATARNREPILQVLERVLPPQGTVLEIASGSGEHAIFFAPRLAGRHWLPSDIDPSALTSIEAWRQTHPCDSLAAPVRLDATDSAWPQTVTQHVPENCPVVAIVTINMIHISPWQSCLGLMAGAGALLPPQGVLYLYGPFQRHGRHTAPSNEAFDRSFCDRKTRPGACVP
ncbi:hypothetical protein XM38_017910 [Halomicronema hongdechloris C2206]|uniref:SAM-dependent methyltransferase n=1 Tax=Halomicronema hongdechloris C2206 TaxID=1641165 RepID=A0A1Z3HKJ8_9CYAN|nr:hypothetical protein XM38_017910 [Halomicronema hongdechloris C2206]